jgi:hypothetical protein
VRRPSARVRLRQLQRHRDGPPAAALRPVRDEPAAARHAGPSRPGIPAQLQPLLAHFSDAGSPRTVTGWLTGMPGGRLLAALAATAHRRQLTHALLDEQAQTPALHRVRIAFGLLSSATFLVDRTAPENLAPPARAGA